MARFRGWPTLGLVGLLMVGGVTSAHARADDALLAEFRAGFPELFPPPGDGRVQPMAVPDIFGPGPVLDVGNIHMKVPNYALIGNPFTNLSSDPSAQWPGASGIEYLNFILFGVGGVNKTTTDPAGVRRVSLFNEWRPQTLDEVDRPYKSYDGQVFGQRFFDDDHDAERASVDPLVKSQFVDEDFLDGRDNDGDGLIDEDYAAYGQQMWSSVFWDNTPQALATTFAEKHVPLNLECRQTGFAFSVPGFQDFNAINWTIFNRSGHAIDSMYVGVRWDMDTGPVDNPVYFNDDVDIPFFPHGDFTVVLSGGDKWGAKMDPKGYRRQGGIGSPFAHEVIPSVSSDSSLCPRVVLRVNGFSVVDNDGDAGRTQGIPSILLLGHTTDPLGLMAPARVGWHQFRSFIGGTPYTSGGNPAVDAQRAEMFASGENIDPVTGFITATPVDQEGDIQGWASIGPFGNTDEEGVAHPIPDGGSIEVTIAVAVQRGDQGTVNQFPTTDYPAYLDGRMTANDLFAKYPALENAFTAQVAYEGIYDSPPALLADGGDHINTPNFHGRETRLRAPPGLILSASDCREEQAQHPQGPITEFGYTWFDFDCDYCTGVWVFGSGPGGGSGKILKRWNTAAPPPNPALNASAGHNFSDNPERRVAPGQDQAVLLTWDNLSEVSVDPEKGEFDLRSYRLWKVSNWRRPVGASGPADDDWTLLAHFRFFDYADSNKDLFPDSVMVARGFSQSARDSVLAGQLVCPQVYIPNLSVQTIVCEKARFITLSAAKGWVISNGYKSEGGVSEDASTWRFRQADGECRYNSFHSVGIENGVRAEACLNALAETRGFRVPICLYRGDLWDVQSGEVLRPTPDGCTSRAADGTCLVGVDTLCVKDDNKVCLKERGKVVGTNTFVDRIKYPIGRYQYLDREVKNGFVYFYAVTAGDSTASGPTATELTGRRSAVEAEGVYPQAATRPVGQVWVVPNPYRGYADIGRRPSAWDLTPNATDPTGTHLDFMGLPSGRWTVQIFTVSGDLVQVLRSEDAVNESVRGPATVRNPNFNPSLPEDPVRNPKTITFPGFNRQADTPNDGQARWNLISRNGQDVVSGVYMFVVESDQGTQRGKFVVIR